MPSSARRSRERLRHVVFGNALQTSADAIYMARHVGLKAGLPIETPAVTVNRLCGSASSDHAGAQLILLGEAEAVLAGGAESMSSTARRARSALGTQARPAPLEDLLWEALKDPHAGYRWPRLPRASREVQAHRKEVDEVGRSVAAGGCEAGVDACAFRTRLCR